MRNLLGERRLHAASVVSDLLRVAALASVVAALVWYSGGDGLRFGLVFAVMLVPRLMRLPAPVDIVFCASLLLACWARTAGWYREVVWTDEVVHVLTPGATAAALYLVLLRLELLPDPFQPGARHRHVSVVVQTFVLGLALATVWEWYEWLAHRASSDFQVTYDDTTTYNDTIVDLVMGGLGSLLAGVALGWRRSAGVFTRNAAAGRP